jgi:hypothetical protein
MKRAFDIFFASLGRVALQGASARMTSAAAWPPLRAFEV